MLIRGAEDHAKTGVQERFAAEVVRDELED
jgi:hypothetical protein